jgi:hypothetical protein
MRLKSSVRRLFACLALPLGTAALSAGCAGLQASALQGDMPKPGKLVAVGPDRLNGLPDASRNLVISYVSTSFDGSNAIVAGQVAIPRTPPPAGGYPVMGWASGATGLAPQCAPSMVGNPTRDAFLNEWVKRGYAVVRTDYAGWGAFGPVPDLHGRSNAENLIDAVTAAHSIDARLSNDWLAVGHSKGGGAVLWVAGLPDRTDGRYPLKGTIAIAPTGPGVLKFMSGVMKGEPVAQSALPFVALTVMNAKALNPTIHVKDLAWPSLQPHLVALESACVSHLFSMPPLPPGPYLKAGAAYDEYARLLAAQDASALTLRVPVSIIQAENDETTVTPETTAQMVRSLCARGASVRFRQYPGQKHRSVIPASQDDAFDFATMALTGGKQRNDCT